MLAKRIWIWFKEIIIIIIMMLKLAPEIVKSSYTKGHDPSHGETNINWHLSSPIWHMELILYVA